jgi:serine/threonine protein kinase/Flp pilus assembly protein TadD
MSVSEPGAGEDPDPTFRLARPQMPDTGPTARLNAPVPPPSPGELADLGRPPADDTFPVPGNRIVHYELVEELGRGAFARVFLAKQESLANRLVALKVTTTPTDEPQKLARLQHPNVVPVYSVHEAGHFQVLCMPFLGRVTLSRVVARLISSWESPPTSGRELLSALLPDTRVTASSTDAEPKSKPANPLAGLSFVDAGLWLVGQLAAGLAHAHERGILHRDLKPANVLITTDGTPMLLDFNVSSESARSRPGLVGGTLPYMAPEHVRAFAGEEAVVDERSDLYSLGVILYELLTGRSPYPLPIRSNTTSAVSAMLEQRSRPPESPRQFNPAVSSAAAAVVLKLLAPNPADRYVRAEDLRDDLTRQLTHRPLKFAPNPSVSERVAKWRHRNPRLATGLAVAAAACVFLLLPAAGYALHARHARQQAEAALVETEAENARLAAQAREAERAQALVGFHAATSDLETAAVQLASRFDPALRDQGLTLARDVLSRYALATEPDWQARPAFARLEPAEQDRLKAALAETLILMTRAEAQKGGYSAESVAAALRWNELADRLTPAADRPAVLARHRAELEARRDGKPVQPPAASPVAGNTDLYFDGLDLAAAGQYREALPLLARFTDRKPSDFRGWFARGMCHGALGQPADAAAAFAVCVALRPDFPHAHLNRGLAHLRLQRFAEAEADFTRALELKPGWDKALLHRGLARDELRKFPEAEADYTAALALPNAPTRLLFLRADTRAARGEIFGTAADCTAAMTREPADAISYGARGKRWMDAGKWDRALADFDAALRLNPTMRDALLDKAVVLGDGLNREDNAIPVLDRLLELYPDDVEARAGRGVYLARRGRAAEARRDAAEVLKVDRSAFRLYQMAGLFAQLSKSEPAAKDEALRLFGRALRAGFGDWQMINDDPDITPIRDDPTFKKLLAEARDLDRGGK